jgi:hypothetical protein
VFSIPWCHPGRSEGSTVSTISVAAIFGQPGVSDRTQALIEAIKRGIL